MLNNILKQSMDFQYGKRLKRFIRDLKMDVSYEYVIQCLFDADPTDNHKYASTIFKDISFDIYKFKEKFNNIEKGIESDFYKEIKTFDKELSKFTSIDKDFMSNIWLWQLNEYSEKYKIINNLIDCDNMDKISQKDANYLINNTIFVYDKNNTSIVVPLNKKSAIFWGNDTLWTFSLNEEAIREMSNKIISTTSDEKYEYYKYGENSYNEDTKNNKIFFVCINPKSKYLISNDSVINSDDEYAYDDFLQVPKNDIIRKLIIYNNGYNYVAPPDYNNQKECEFFAKYSPISIVDMYKNISDTNRLNILSKIAVESNKNIITWVDMTKITNYGELFEISKQNKKCNTFILNEFNSLSENFNFIKEEFNKALNIDLNNNTKQANKINLTI